MRGIMYQYLARCARCFKSRVFLCLLVVSVLMLLVQRAYHTNTVVKHGIIALERKGVDRAKQILNFVQSNIDEQEHPNADGGLLPPPPPPPDEGLILKTIAQEQLPINGNPQQHWEELNRNIDNVPNIEQQPPQAQINVVPQAVPFPNGPQGNPQDNVQAQNMNQAQNNVPLENGGPPDVAPPQDKHIYVEPDVPAQIIEALRQQNMIVHVKTNAPPGVIDQIQQQPQVNQQQPEINQQPPQVNQPPQINQQYPQINQQPPQINQQPLQVNQQPLQINQQPPQINQQSPQVNQQPPEVNQQPPQVNQQQPQINQQLPQVNQQPPQVNQQPPQVNQQPPEVNQQPPEVNQQQSHVNQQIPQVNQQMPQVNQQIPQVNQQQLQANQQIPQVNQQIPQVNQQPQQINQQPQQINQQPQQGPDVGGGEVVARMPAKDEETPVIIAWNGVGGNSEYDLTCKNNMKCRLTPDKKEHLKHELAGIMFYGTDFGESGFPLPRQPLHLWSVLHEESPKNNDWLFTAPGAMEMFNLTGTFKRESHYSFPTFWLQNKNDLMSMEHVVSLARKNELRKEGLAPIIFVHNDCNTPSDRSHYLHMLQQYVQVDSYGKCDHNKDFPSQDMAFSEKTGMSAMTSEAFYNLTAQYKFAFAFENAACDDYVTEKFWRPLTLGVVPIVFGSSKIKDFAPSDKSIINIRDFDSVKAVADLIKHLDTNDEEYAKYTEFKYTGITNPTLKADLDNRDYGKGVMYESVFTGFECFMCEKLHEMRRQVVSGQPVEVTHGSDEQYGCPYPKKFNEEGQYVVERSESWEPHVYAKHYLQSIKHHLDNNINNNITEIHRYAQKLFNADGRNV